MVIIKEQTNSYGNQIKDWKKEDRIKKYIRRCKMRPPHNKDTQQKRNNKINQKAI